VALFATREDSPPRNVAKPVTSDLPAASAAPAATVEPPKFSIDELPIEKK
jgi:hypothetical protein